MDNGVIYSYTQLYPTYTTLKYAPELFWYYNGVDTYSSNNYQLGYDEMSSFAMYNPFYFAQMSGSQLYDFWYDDAYC